jgi:hypothetical protein
MLDRVDLFLVCVFMALCVIIGIIIGGEWVGKSKINECELELTRNQSCVLIAVPEVK